MYEGLKLNEPKQETKLFVSGKMVSQIEKMEKKGYKQGDNLQIYRLKQKKKVPLLKSKNISYSNALYLEM